MFISYLCIYLHLPICYSVSTRRLRDPASVYGHRPENPRPDGLLPRSVLKCTAAANPAINGGTGYSMTARAYKQGVISEIQRLGSQSYFTSLVVRPRHPYFTLLNNNHNSKTFTNHNSSQTLQIFSKNRMFTNSCLLGPQQQVIHYLEP